MTKPLVIITGASGGIGAAIARRIPSSYDTLGIDQERPSDEWRGRFLTIELDSIRSIDQASTEINNSTSEIAAIIFAAGVYRRLALDEYDLDKFNRVFWSNFNSVFFLTQRLLPRLINQRSGRIIVVGSQAAVLGGSDPGYAASKGALHSFMKSVAREFGPYGVRCNSVSPGPVNTKMSRVMGSERTKFYLDTIPIKRFCTPDEVAEVVVFLATGAVDALNGSTIDIDGGLVRR